MKLDVRALIAMAGTAAFAGMASGQTFRVFYFEGFETVNLGAPVDEDDLEGVDTTDDGMLDILFNTDGDAENDVWAGPDAFVDLGWSVDTPNTPGFPSQLNLGVEEWREWAITNSVWWTTVADDQDRSQFANGFATGSAVAVADPDEWDDISAPFTDPVTGIVTQESPENLTLWTSTLSTPMIGLPVDKEKEEPARTRTMR